MSKIQELENKINELQKEINGLKKSSKRWRATLGGRYYYVCSSGEVSGYTNAEDDIDDHYYSIGNHFMTRKEAEQYKEKLLITQELKDLALELNNGVEIDWYNDSKRKYLLAYDHESKTLYIDRETHYQGSIYCLNKNFLVEAIKRIGEKRLKLLFGAES